MKLLLTGATGRLGSATHRELISAGFDVRATDVSRKKDAPGKVIVGDLLNREFCYQVAEDIEVLVHIANHPNAWAGNAQKVFNENVAMNMNIFQASLESGVRKILYASSVQAFVGWRLGKDVDQPSNLSYLPIDGDAPQRPGNPYALSKCAGELQLKYFVEQHKLPSAVAMRFPMLMGKAWFAEWRARHSQGDHMPGNAIIDEAFTWLAFEDAARLFAACVKCDLPGYRCYMPAHPTARQSLTPQQMIERFFKGVPLKKPITEIKSMVDISRITADTGWTPIENFWDAETKPG